ncbi:MAG: aspartate-semialdehyde dehydrogenase [Senegalia sp. (in: firmicutes)]|uniref:aspartate-semialdehyde dehydrogenase n=1 Tax=Senegalia sp. (in: firmicutes) TaxID=1924098 RepID=UPI003F97CAE0
MKSYNLAIVGSTGLVGSTMIKVLEERNFPINKIKFLASKKSAGNKIKFKEKEYVVEELTPNSFKDMEYALFAAGGEVSEKYAEIAVENGVIVIDNSSVFRLKKNVPLVVPEVNPDDIKWNNGIIANPNCSTIQSVVPLTKLHEKLNIKRIVYSTYQAVSGSGLKGLEDLENGTNKCYPYSIRGNVLPHIDVFQDNGYTKEEMKMINETKKILNDNNIKITATAVRVPVEYSHSVSVNLEFEKPFDLEEIISILDSTKGVIVMDNINENIYPLAKETKGKDEVYVGRIRRDFSVENGINLWVVADNVRKGAATNAVQILELLIK